MKVLESREFEPKEHKWSALLGTIIFVLFMLCVVAYDWIETHPPKPPAVVSQYEYEAPEDFRPPAPKSVWTDTSQIVFEGASTAPAGSVVLVVDDNADYSGEGGNDCALLARAGSGAVAVIEIIVLNGACPL